jgi:ABC-type sugar transport system ATPase subunit
MRCIPHMTVGENMAFSLRLRNADATMTKERVAKAAKILNLDAAARRPPRELSGGQRQRVAMGRAIVRDPEGVPVRRAAVQSRCEAARRDARPRSRRCTSA